MHGSVWTTEAHVNRLVSNVVIVVNSRFRTAVVIELEELFVVVVSDINHSISPIQAAKIARKIERHIK